MEFVRLKVDAQGHIFSLLDIDLGGWGVVHLLHVLAGGGSGKWCWVGGVPESSSDRRDGRGGDPYDAHFLGIGFGQFASGRGGPQRNEKEGQSDRRQGGDMGQNVGTEKSSNA